MGRPFKRCPSCHQQWQTRDHFLEDPLLVLNGYKADREKLEYGLFFFTLQKEGCFSTLAIEAVDFLDLYRGTRFEKKNDLVNYCQRRCRDKKKEICQDGLCECDFAEEICALIASRSEQKR